MIRTLLVSCGKAQFHRVPIDLGDNDPRSVLLAALVLFDMRGR